MVDIQKKPSHELEKSSYSGQLVRWETDIAKVVTQARMQLILVHPIIFPYEIWQLVVEYATHDSRVMETFVHLIQRDFLLYPCFFVSYTSSMNVSGAMSGVCGPYLVLVHKNFKWMVQGVNAFQVLLLEDDVTSYWKPIGCNRTNLANFRPLWYGVIDELYKRIYASINMPDPLFVQCKKDNK